MVVCRPGRQVPCSAPPPLSWGQVDRRLEGKPKPQDSHKLCLAQFGGVTSILCVLEYHENGGGHLLGTEEYRNWPAAFRNLWG